MDTFIFIGDYNRQIQSDNLQQIIGNNQTTLEAIQLAAVEECISFLKQKYDTSQAFQAITQHDKTKTYKAGQTVYLNAAAYDHTLTYTVGSIVLESGNIYTNTAAITHAEAWTIAHWTLIAAQYSTYYAIYPQTQFNYLHLYSRGDNVFYKDKVYNCKIGSGILDHAAMLEIGSPVESRITNIFPDDALKGLQYWGTGTDYSVLINTVITDTDYWAPGDNRDQKFLQTCINIVLYHAHLRISPRNVPESREKFYMGLEKDRTYANGRILYPIYSALGWLQAAADGTDITPNLPLLQPTEGMRIRFGGNSKLQNTY
jgi:hypothetical protein